MLLFGLRNYARDRVFSDFLSSRIIPQGTVVTRFELVELSGAMLLALARRGTRAKVNSAQLVCDRLVLFVLVQSMFLHNITACNELCCCSVSEVTNA